MANISRNTFDRLKHYVSVRMQQGVPLVDADWNEKDDIRKNEIQLFLKWFIGNGIPKGNDGFHILPHAEDNNFLIKGGANGQPGICLIEGWDARNETDIAYKAQSLFNNTTLAQKWGVTTLPALTLPTSGQRTDLVYLDAWEREVNAIEDPNLVNPAINIETCVRLKREWVVRVAEGTSTLPTAVPAGHVFYPLATIIRKAGQPVIAQADITDLRTIGLSMLGDPITIKNNNVGIGVPDPLAKLEVAGDIVTNVAKISDDPHGSLFAAFSHKNQGTSTGYALLQHQDGESYLNAPAAKNIRFRINNEDKMFLKSDGNVGIGTTEPAAKLDVKGVIRISTGSSWDNLQIATDGYGSYVQASGANTGLILKAANEDNVPTNVILQPDGGNVGIGTSAPADKLEVNGNVRIDPPGTVSFGSTTRQMINLWQTAYGIGIQDSTQYFRTGLNFAWYQGGSHNDGALNPGGGTAVMVIKNGNAGIGTTAPQKKLHVVGGSLFEGQQNHFKDAENKGRVRVGAAWGIPGIYSEDGEDIVMGMTTGKKAYIGTNPNFVTVLSNGSMGIGINDPGGDKLDVRGKCYSSGGWWTINSDYAEYFESENGEAIPRGTAVSITAEGKIKAAQEGETLIGVISVSPSIVGNVPKEWPGKYLRDDFGEIRMETYEEEGEGVTKTRPMLNPDYDESMDYTPRDQRPEWNCVGLLGQIPLLKGQPTGPNWVKIKDISDKVELWLIK